MARVYINPGKITFKGKIQRNTEVDNSSAWIEFPYDLKETYGVGNLVPFKAIFDGKITYSGSLAKMGRLNARYYSVKTLGRLLENNQATK
jgi:hypothetical protein